MSFQADPGQVSVGAFKNVGSIIGTAGINAAALAQASAETAKLVDAAKSGGFKISPEGVAPLRKALADMAEKLEGLFWDTGSLDQAPQLGSHPYGHTVANHDQKSASQSTGSAKVVLEQFKQVLKSADEALARASGLYKEAENQAISATSTIQA
ncbi:hypothetical protein [Amycolatopsis sp. NPDC004378]